MKNKKIGLKLLIVLFTLFFSINFGAASLNAFLSGSFTKDGNITFSGSVSPATTSDINIIVWDKNNNVLSHNDIVTASSSGFFTKSYNDLNAVDYNALIIDVNHDTNAVFSFTVSEFADIDINFVGLKPPFQKDANIVFKLIPKDVNGKQMSSYNDLNVVLFDSSGKILDKNSNIKKSLDDNQSVEVNFTASQTGTLFISVNNGAKTFPVNVYSLRVFAATYNDENEATDFFANGDRVTIQVRVTSFDGKTLYTGSSASLDGNIEKPDGNISTLSFSPVRGIYQATYNASLTGVHTVRIKTIVGSNTQTTFFTFKVQKYRMNIISKKNDNVGSKERMPSVFAPDSNASYKLNFTNLATEKKLAGSDVNGLCNKNNYTVKIQAAGTKTGTQLANSDFNLTQTTTGCDINIAMQNNPGFYIIKVKGKNLNIKGQITTVESETTSIVQNFVVFMDPVDPSTYSSDPERARKFKFFKDENVGFKPSVIGLSAGLSGKVKAVNSVKIISPTGEKVLNPSYYDYNTDLNLLTIKANAFTDNNVQDGMLPLHFTVDVNSLGAGKDENNINAFGGMIYKSMDVIVTPASNALGTEKTDEFGPVIYKASDENIYLKVTVKDASGTAVRFATVSVKEIQNMEFWEKSSVAGISSEVTNSNGVAVLNLGKLSSGGYFIKVQAKKDSTTGFGETFIIAKKYIVFAEPVEVSNGVCEFQNNYGKDSNVGLLLVSMDPFDFNTVNDFSLSSVKVLKEGGLKEFEKPVPYDANYSLKQVNCQFFEERARDYNVINLEAGAIGWETGFYRVQLSGSSASRGSETGIGFFKVQPFTFELIPLGQKGDNMSGPEEDLETVEPGNWFDFNVFSGNNVNIAAIIEKENTFQEIDEQIVLRKGTTDLNSNTGFDVNKNKNVTISAMIPEKLMPGNYLLIVEATDENGNKAESELFLEVSRFKMIIARSNYWNSQPSTMKYKKSFSGQIDANIMDDLLKNAKYSTTADVTGITYDRWIDNNANGMQHELNDWNTLVLVNTATNTIYIDLTNDGNFNNDNALNNSFFAVRPGEKLKDINLVVFNDINNVYVEDGNHPLLTNISLHSNESLKYLRFPQELMLTSTENNWIGSYNVDRNVMIPILVKKPSGNPISGAIVQITKVFRITSGFGPPLSLDPSKWTAFTAITDANGLALPVVRINSTGNYLLEIRITVSGSSQVFFPWEGPVFSIEKYQLETLLSKPTKIRIDFNNPFDASFDLTRINPGDVYTDTYGLFSEKDKNYDFDNDGNTDENWYFIKINPASGLDFNVLVDDDKNIDLELGVFTDGSIVEGGQSTETRIKTQPWSGCTANFTANKNDCNLFQGRYWVDPSDDNAVDNNVWLQPVIIFEPDENNNYSLYWNKNQPNYSDRNVQGLIEIKTLDGARAKNEAGSVTATLFKNTPDSFTPIGTFNGSISNGIARVGFGDLDIATYDAEYDLNFMDGNTQKIFTRFSVR